MSGDLLGGRYRILAELGRGGMGVVYVAYDPMLGRYVAVKLLNPDYSKPEALERLRREVQMQARLEHANIVRVYDVGSLPNGRGLFFVMEYVEGVPFGKFAAEANLAERLHVICDVCRGLAFAHSRNFIHRDLKTENVLVSVSGEAKLADFGLGRAVEEECRLTRQGSTVGSVHYMAPEQGCGKPVDHRTDLYSLGVLLYRITTGKVPFIGRQHEVISQHLHSKPTKPRSIDASIPEELESLILTLMEKDPSRRPASAEAVGAELDRLRASYWPIISPQEVRKSIGSKTAQLATLKLNFPCPKCGRQRQINITDTHKKIRCSRCNHSFEVVQCKTASPAVRSTEDKADLNPLADALDEVASDEAVAPTEPIQRTSPTRKSKRNRFSVSPATFTVLGVAILAAVCIAIYFNLPVPPATVRVTSDAEQATVLVDGEQVGVTPCEVQLKPGSHEVTATWRDFTDRRTVRVESKQRQEVPFVLLPPGLLTVTCNFEAAVVVDNESKGPTPCQIKLRPGPHEILVRRGSTSDRKKIEITAGTEREVAFTLPQPPAVRIAVKSNVRGAGVYVGKTLRGIAPLAIDLDEGQHEVELRFASSTKRQAITVKTGQPQEVSIDFPVELIAETLRWSTCLVKTPGGHGSGFLINDTKTVATAAHVLDDARTIQDLQCVFFAPPLTPGSGVREEHQVRAKALIHYDRKRDLAVVLLDQSLPNIRPAFFLADAMPDITTAVVAVGNPESYEQDSDKVHISVLESKQGTIDNNTADNIQLSMKLRPGYSGGPVFLKKSGDVVGVVSSTIRAKENDVSEVAFIVPWHPVAVALDIWNKAADDERQAIAERMKEKFARAARHRSVLSLSFRMWLTSLVNRAICSTAAVDAAEALDAGGIVGLRKWNNEVWPVLTKEVRRNFSPVHDELVDNLYEQVLQDPEIEEQTKQKVKKVHAEYAKLKKEAEAITDRTILGFVERVKNIWDRLDKPARDLNEKAADALNRDF